MLKKTSLFVVFSLLFATFSFAQSENKAAASSAAAIIKRSNIPVYAPSADKAVEQVKDAERNRQAVTVPSRSYPKIQDALNARECKIAIRPGYYKESLTVFPTCNETKIRAEIPGTVILDGDNRANTVTAWPEASVFLENITIRDNQRMGNYDSAAVFGWGGVSFRIYNCVIMSRSIGLSTAYAMNVDVRNTKFAGLAQDSIGIMTALNNELDRRYGVRVYDNFFTTLEMGIYNYELHDAGVKTVARCQGNGCMDSNQYSDVELIFLYENNG